MVRLRTFAVCVVSVALLATPALAVDGVLEINQAAAFAGSITPGDTPGFPVSINAAGSYRLTGNLDVTKAQNGSPQANSEDITAIEVSVNNVSIDLNGFSILGPTRCNGSCSPTGDGYGITHTGIDPSPNNITVMNGTIRGMGFRGIQVGTYSRIERVKAISNGGVGIQVGSNSEVVSNMASSNGSAGIAASTSIVKDNVALQNLDDGIFTQAPRQAF